MIEAKPVEKIFCRFTEILHLHVGGQVIRTTAEHPFYAYDKGWKSAADLVPGDWLLTGAGGWQQVEELFATGEMEVVYNLRVADYHTYFVGGDDWGWAAWAHNAYVAPMPRPTMPVTTIGGKQVYGTAQNSQAAQQVPNNQNPHFNRINDIVAALAPGAPEGTYFVLNRSWRTGLGEPNAQLTPRFAPDMIVVQPLDAPGTPNRRFKIHAFEVDHVSRQAHAQQQLNDGWATVNLQNGEIIKGTQIPVLITGSIPTITW